MSRRLSLAGLVLAWLCAQGALTEGIQVFAWAQMFSGYVQTMSWQAALTETFDPEKPCGLCCVVRKAREARHRAPDGPPPLREGEKLVLALVDADEEETRCVIVAIATHDDPAPAGWRAPVPTPPPRLARG